VRNESDTAKALAGATPFLKLTGAVAGGWLLAESAIAAGRRLAEGRGDDAFAEAKLRTARFYAEHILPMAPAMVPAVTGGANVMSFDLDRF
jgi:3-(methylthio)propanoyl-CoA dehydrogenase